MSNVIQADATPEKRLFVSLITRDIPLSAAFLDLIDNSVNAAIEPYADQLASAQGYLDTFENPSIRPATMIKISIDASSVQIIDDASGISTSTAESHVFKFGRDPGEHHKSDRLSVYGIGLKRAMFKLGRQIEMISDHVDGGFELSLNVPAWEQTPGSQWTFPILARGPVPAKNTGTKIVITELNDEVTQRISDGTFIEELKTSISKTYSYFLTKFVIIQVNQQSIEPFDLKIGENLAKDYLVEGDVSCAITAGIGLATGGMFRDQSSGWFVLCNGRTVVSADKTPLTGWSGPPWLPIFQPKHRPFLGTVYFVSSDPLLLPWNTTKSALNEDSSIWQTTKRRMVSVGRPVINFLDRRYTDEGTEFLSKDLVEAAGESRNVIASVAAEQKTFSLPIKKPPRDVKIQYYAKTTDVKRVAEYLGRPSMSGSEVGRHTLHHFLRNEVGEE